MDSDIKELRAYTRLREDHIASASKHINQTQKALTLMNIRLKEVLSQVHGFSGMAIIEANPARRKKPGSIGWAVPQKYIKNKKRSCIKGS